MGLVGRGCRGARRRDRTSSAAWRRTRVAHSGGNRVSAHRRMVGTGDRGGIGAAVAIGGAVCFCVGGNLAARRHRTLGTRPDGCDPSGDVFRDGGLRCSERDDARRDAGRHFFDLAIRVALALLAGAAALVIPRIASAQTASRHRLSRRAVRAGAIGHCTNCSHGTFSVARALDQHPIVGPEPGSWFRRIGWDVSYGVPLAAIALTLVGYAIRDRSSQFAFAAGLLFNVVATIVVLMRLARGGGTLDAVAWITVAQVNAIVAGGVALAWLAAMWRGANQRVPGQEQAVSAQDRARASSYRRHCC